MGRPRGDMWEVAVWEDALAADDREVHLTYQERNEAIVIPETVDCISALSELKPNGAASIAKTDATLGICNTFLPATARPISEAAPLERPVVG
jgi:glyceraldehyde-3-phosphate dehydrogenase (NAD(P))